MIMILRSLTDLFQVFIPHLFHVAAARQAQNPNGSLDPDVIAKRTKRHLDELEVRSRIRKSGRCRVLFPTSTDKPHGIASLCRPAFKLLRTYRLWSAPKRKWGT